MPIKLRNEINNTITARRATMTDKLKSAAWRSSRQFKLRSKERVDRSTGMVFAIGFSFEQHGIFVEKGVGKGRGINSGKTNPMPWFNPIMDEEVPLLANELGLDIADLLQKALIN